LFGCDTCQEACPHNRQNENHVASVGAEVNVTQLDRILKMKEDEFRVQFMGSALKRAKLVSLQRNACVVLGNAGDEAAVQPLASVFSGGAPLVRAHAAWALGRIGSEKARGALESTVGRESDVGVLEEVRRALNGAP
jgi:epoxyqueuosine reductase